VTAVPARRQHGGLVPPPRRLTGLPARVRVRADQLVAEGHETGLVVEEVPEATLPNGKISLVLYFHPRPTGPAALRWWQGRSWKFWTPVAAGGVLAFGGCLVAAVIVLTAAVAAAVVIAKMALGAAILIAAIAGLSSIRGGGTWSGSGTWR
jgi:hypothetical protein